MPRLFGVFLLQLYGFFARLGIARRLMKRSELLFSAITVPLDYVALALAALAAYWIRYVPAVQQIRPVIFDLRFSEYFSLASVILVGWLLIFSIAGLYRMGGTTRLSEELARVFIACSASMALVLAVMVFSRFLFSSRFIIVAGWLFAVLFVCVERLLVRVVQRQAYRWGVGVHRVVLVGQGHIATVLGDEFSRRPNLGFRIVEQIPQFSEAAAQHLRQLAAQDKFDEVIQLNPNLSAEATLGLLGIVNDFHLDYLYTADLLDTQLINHEVKTIAGTPIISVQRTRLDGWGRILKRIFDVISSMVGILVFSPLMLLIAILILLDSGWPILFSYQRIGQHGKPFWYFKFRSMVKNAHQLRFDPSFLQQHENSRAGSPMVKFRDDPRITRVGKILRRFSLDELTEFFLVLTGKMSIVGPRPHEAEEVGRYAQHHKKLLTIKPGMTGLAQVSGRSDLSFEEEVKLDTFYIEHWSLWLDIQIILKTPWAVFRPRRTV